MKRLEIYDLGVKDYYPFGMLMVGRNFESGSAYRYGFGGQEEDNEISGRGAICTAEFWEYDARLGKRWNSDPIAKAWLSPYLVFSNNPLIFIDPNGNSDYYTEGGKYIGSDGTDGTDIMIVTDKQTIENIWSQTKSGIKKDGYAVFAGTLAENTFFTLPPKSHRDQIKQIIDSEDKDGYTEYGGRGLMGTGDKSKSYIMARSEDGFPSGPDDDAASITLSKINGGVDGDEFKKVMNSVGGDPTPIYYWHSHPGGSWTYDDKSGKWMTSSDYMMKKQSIIGQSFGEETIRSFGIGPSAVDLELAKERYTTMGVQSNFVISKKLNLVFFYNQNTDSNTGHSGKISLKLFFSLEAKKKPS